MIGARPLDDKEISRMLKTGFNGIYKHRNRSLFALGISTGFRAGELLSLNMRDVIHRKYPRKYIKVRRKHTKGKTQGRTMQLHKFAREILQYWIDERLAETELASLLDEPVFISRECDTRTGQIQPISLQQVANILNDAFQECGISDSVSSHSMRKTFAKKAYEDAIQKFKNDEILVEPLRVVQQQLGHKNIQNTLSYLSFLGDDISPDLFSFPDFT